MNRLFCILICCIPFFSTAQKQATISGYIADKQTALPLAGASIRLIPGNNTTISDKDGLFKLRILPGTYTVSVSFAGYQIQYFYNMVLSTGNETVLPVELEWSRLNLDTVTVLSTRKTAKAASLQTPLSVQRLTTEEIRSNPGGNFDISRVIQTLPGVSGTSGSVGAFRNDIIIRGGAPNENVFYLDGIEIPNINHFATQGSGGGPTGILNVSFMQEVKLNTSAFDSRFDNPLSSVFEIKQRVGNSTQTQGNIRLSATELSLTLDGPLHKKSNTTYMVSARRSYLQLLFQLLDLPIRPNYWDFQYKVSTKLKPGTTINFIGIGAIDQFSFAAPKSSSPENIYVLNSNPSIQQRTYTIGATLRHNIKNGMLQAALSRNVLDNRNEKFQNNLGPDKGLQTLNIESIEQENKLRLDINQNLNGTSLSYGVVLQYNGYSISNFQVIAPEQRDVSGDIISPAVTNEFTSNLSLLRYGVFVQAGRRFMGDKIGLNAGLRTDGNSFTTTGGNLWQTLSPRLALNWVLTNEISFNASAGIFYKIPTYTVLGFQNNNGEWVNKGSRYARSIHYVAGFEYLPKSVTRFTVEAFVKRYDRVPVSLRNGISLANLGGDFSILGNEAVATIGKGRSFGIEFFAQQKLTRHFFGVLSYTFFRSEYTGLDEKWVASAWENRHLVSGTLGLKLKKNWELGVRFRYQGGAPYTPFDTAASRSQYLTLGSGVLDYTRLNSLRLGNFNAADIRIDKKIFFKKVALDVFVDIQNFYAAVAPAYPQYTFLRTADNSGFQTTDGLPVESNGLNAIPYILPNTDAQITPTIGFILEF
jgi:outer membrane receptor for ferrienterochelin and colicin